MSGLTGLVSLCYFFRVSFLLSEIVLPIYLEEILFLKLYISKIGGIRHRHRTFNALCLLDNHYKWMLSPDPSHTAAELYTVTTVRCGYYVGGNVWHSLADSALISPPIREKKSPGKIANAKIFPQKKTKCEGCDSNAWTSTGMDLKSIGVGRAFLPSQILFYSDIAVWSRISCRTRPGT